METFSPVIAEGNILATHPKEFMHNILETYTPSATAKVIPRVTVEAIPPAIVQSSPIARVEASPPAMVKRSIHLLMHTTSIIQSFHRTPSPIQTIMGKHIQEMEATFPVLFRVPAWMEDTEVFIQALCSVIASHLPLIEMKDLQVILTGI
jgi:hypothetical protein